MDALWKCDGDGDDYVVVVVVALVLRVLMTKLCCCWVDVGGDEWCDV